MWNEIQQRIFFSPFLLFAEVCFLKNYINQSIKKISGSVCEFISHFLTRNLKKWGQKLILGNDFINKNSDDFYVL